MTRGQIFCAAAVLAILACGVVTVTVLTGAFAPDPVLDVKVCSRVQNASGYTTGFECQDMTQGDALALARRVGVKEIILTRDPAQERSR
jgi:hypothetical protein